MTIKVFDFWIDITEGAKFVRLPKLTDSQLEEAVNELHGVARLTDIRIRSMCAELIALRKKTQPSHPSPVRFYAGTNIKIGSEPLSSARPWSS